MRLSPIEYVKDRIASAGHQRAPRLNRICSGEGLDVALTSLVVGYDRQPESRAALDVAIDLANRVHASLQVVHLASLRDYPIDPDLGDWEDYARARLAEEQAVVTEALREYALGWNYYVANGDPARRLIDAAEEHDALMIIVGSRDPGLSAWLGQLVEPAVSRRLIQESRRPVLLVGQANERPEQRR
jgi:nucleotide-binding universal stress UspA family protein